MLCKIHAAQRKFKWTESQLEFKVSTLRTRVREELWTFQQYNSTFYELLEFYTALWSLCPQRDRKSFKEVRQAICRWGGVKRCHARMGGVVEWDDGIFHFSRLPFPSFTSHFGFVPRPHWLLCFKFAAFPPSFGGRMVGAFSLEKVKAYSYL